jgi:hypothetical protein
VWEVDGTPVSVGRKQRIAPARTRRLIQDRDRGCVFPGCQATGYLEVHHLDHWADGGATDLDRLVCLCPFHHDAHHRGEFTITGCPIHPDRILQSIPPDPGAAAGLVFTTARGLVIGAPPAPRAMPTESPKAVGAYRGPTAEAYRGPTGERLHTRWLDLPPNRPVLAVVPAVDTGADAEVGGVNQPATLPRGIGPPSEP